MSMKSYNIILKRKLMMKKKIILFIAMFISYLGFSQVGINTEAPKATLDVVYKSTAGVPAGVIVPRLTGDELKAMDELYGTEQNGTIIYATDPVGTASDKTKRVTIQGYYYYDASQQKWIAMGSITEPWQNVTTGEAATANVENIYQTGKVAIGSGEIHESAIFQVNANNKGVLIPRLTTAERGNIASPADGLLIYNKTTGCYNYYASIPSKWLSICGEPDPAIINIIDCTGAGPNGTYKKATTLTSANTYTIKVNVLQDGPYTISAYTGNGYSFSKSGTFTSTGTYTLELEGQGTPISAQTDNVTLSFNGTGLTSSCTLPTITVANNTTEFTVNCGAITFGGTLKQGIAADGTQYMDVPITGVTTEGNTLVETAIVNGIKYSSGTVAITSSSTSIRLYAQGTPSVIGTFAYLFTAPGSLLPCNVNINVITALGTFAQPANRCYQILQANPSSPDGEYFIKGVNGEAFKTYCDMTNGGYTMLQSYSEKALLNEDADLRNNQNLNWNGNKNYAASVGASGTITYRNFLLPLSVRQTVRSNTSKNLYRVRIVQDAANVANNNDVWANNNYAVFDFSPGTADFISSSGWKTNVNITSKFFGKQMDTYTPSTKVVLDGVTYNNNGAANTVSLANFSDYRSLVLSSGYQFVFNYTNPDGSTTNITGPNNWSFYLWSSNRSNTNSSFQMFNHHIGKCKVGGTTTGAEGDDYQGVVSCDRRYNTYTPHSFNGGEGRYVQWFVK